MNDVQNMWRGYGLLCGISLLACECDDSGISVKNCCMRHCVCEPQLQRNGFADGIDIWSQHISRIRDHKILSYTKELSPIQP